MKYIFIHGLGQNSASWDKAISYLQKPTNSQCPDLSVLLKNKEVTYANLYQSFSEYCKNISEPLNLCGISLGGVLALNYAIDFPERVKLLVLIAAQYKMPRTLLKLQNIIFKFMPGSAFKNMGFQKKDFINLTKSMMDLDFSNNLGNVLCKTLVICGSKDSANKKASKGLAENIPGADFHLIENSGHEVNIDAPEKLATVLNLTLSNTNV